MLLLRARHGRCYLPGGRIEPGETATDALVREIAEECGWEAVVGAEIGTAEQLILGGAVLLTARYWRARLVSPRSMMAEHEIMWCHPPAARTYLHRPGDRQAVAAAG